MTRVLVVGANGLLGHSVVRELSPALDVWALTRQPATSSHLLARWLRIDRWIGGIDVRQDEELSQVLTRCRPQIVINCAGVIKQRLSSPREMWRLNAEVPHRLAHLTHQVGARLIHVSTDCVFDGARGSNRECDHPNATDLYGMSKAAGEPKGEHVLTIRSSHVGFEVTPGPSLLSWVMSRRGNAVDGYVNAKYSGVSTPTFARALRMLVEMSHPLSGVFHLASGPITKSSLLEMLNSTMRLNLSIIPVAEPKIDRTLDARAFEARTGFRVPTWDDMVSEIAETRSDYPYATQ